MGCRFASVVLVFCLCAAAGGCNGSATPRPPARFLAAGTVERVTVWNKPVQRAGELGENTGSSSFKGGRVEVYDQFILITLKGGPTVLSLHGWYTDLVFHRDPQP